MAKYRQIERPSGALFVPRRRLVRAGKLSVKPLDLEGADLHAQDLRSLDFTGANLRFADLRNVQTGIAPDWSSLLFVLSLLLSLAIGALSGVAGTHLHQLIGSANWISRTAGLFIAAELVMFLAAAIWKGLPAAVRNLLLPISMLAVLLASIGAALGGTGLGGGLILTFSGLMFAILALGTLARAVAGGTGTALFMIVAISGALTGKLLGGGVTAFALAIGAMILGRRSVTGLSAAPMLARWSRAIACAPGTSFRNADLRGAQLDASILRCTDFRGARLDGTSATGCTPSMCELDDAQWRELVPGQAGPRGRVVPTRTSHAHSPHRE